jgi:hypothetical protein
VIGLEPRGILFRQDIVPLVSVAAAFAGLLVWWVRRGAARQRERHVATQGLERPSFGRLARHVLGTAVGGYVAFLLIVGLYYLLLGGQTRSFLVQALWGGAFLAFAVAVPTFLVSGPLTGRLRRGRRAD